MLTINYIWSGSINGAQYTMIVNDKEYYLCHGCEEDYAKEEAIIILKQDYNYITTKDKIYFEWDGSL